MKTKIDCDKSLVKEIFNGWFSIPTYQRPYVWESDQVNELLDDIENAKNNNEQQYFLGSIVYQKKEKPLNNSSYTEFELLDGQQRLTTIFLIIASIRDIVFENKKQFDENDLNNIIQTCEELIYQKENKYKNIPERMRIVFDIRKDVKDFVDSYVKETGSTSKTADLELNVKNKNINISIRHISNTILIARNFFLTKITEIGDFLTYLLNNVLLVYIATEDLQDAFQLFTVMNNTGLKLTNSDILKADNLAAIENSEKQEEYAKDWEEMESYFGEDFDNFLSQIRTILVKRKAESALIKEFDENVYSEKKWDKNRKEFVPCKPLLKRGEETFDFINSYFKIYQEIFDKSHFDETKSYMIKNYLTLMERGFENDYWKAPVLMFFKKFRYDNLLNFLKKLDSKISCDWIIGLVPSMRILNINKVLECIENTDSSSQVLLSDALKIDSKSKNDFENVLNSSIYGRKYARYLLLKVDMLSSSQDQEYKPSQTISIEHILPQNPNDASQWKKDFSDEERAEWTDKIGNLTLISRRKNTSQGNLDYEKKVKKYFEKNIETFPSMIKLFKENSKWKIENLKKRQNDIVSLLQSF